MNKLAHSILKRRKLVLFAFLLAMIISILLTPQVGINYSLSDYVPDEAASTKAIKIMGEEFTQTIPNAQVFIPDLTLPEALQYKKQLQESLSVTEVMWLDDVVDMHKPLEFSDSKMVEAYYKDSGALFQVTVSDNDQPGALKALQAIAGENGAVSGQLVDQANAQIAVFSEMGMIIAFAVPLALVILLVSTNSWFEPIILLLAIAVGVVLNMGTNIIFGEISFLTQAIAAVLQLAVSMDYAVFMLHRFNQYRNEGHEIQEALQMAVVKAFSAITASALTTVFGFLALVFMRFKLGPDLGFVLAKGVIFSLISVLFFMPVMISFSYKLMDKTSHRSFIPSMAKIGQGIVKLRWGILILVIFLLVPAFLAQKKNDFIYGMGAYEVGSREERDRELIRSKFGNNMQMAFLVPKNTPVQEKALNEALNEIPEVKSVISLVSMVGAEIPVDLLPSSQISALQSENYSRYVVIADSLPEGDAAFALAEKLRETVAGIYPENAHLAGENFSTLDMSDTIRTDNAIVNGLAVLAIGLVLLFTFRSLSLPLILLLTIEGSIWLNLSVPYFADTQLSYIGYLVISTVQLGATVDYGILYTQHYLDNRKLYAPKKAAALSLAEALPSLLPPALILTGVGYILGFVSSITIVSELGTVLGRGASFSLILVSTFLPALLIFFDKLVGKTTLKSRFIQNQDDKGES